MARANRIEKTLFGFSLLTISIGVIVGIIWTIFLLLEVESIVYAKIAAVFIWTCIVILGIITFFYTSYEIGDWILNGRSA